jgi:pyruvate dehydrogenase (quinone)
LLGKAVIPDDHPNSIGGLGLLGTEPASDADILLMVGTSFPYIDYLPKPGQARGIQIDIKPERIGWVVEQSLSIRRRQQVLVVESS